MLYKMKKKARKGKSINEKNVHHHHNHYHNDRYKSSAETVSELIQKPLPFDRKDLRLSRRYRSCHDYDEYADCDHTIVII